MSDAVWYYAQGDAEHGPVTAVQLRALAEQGKLLPSDLVWKEGMDDWKPANGVRGLFAPEAAGPSPPPDRSGAPPPSPSIVPSSGSSTFEAAASFQPSPRKPRMRGGGAGMSIEPLKYGRFFGQPMLILGLMLVLTARGCDAIGNRGVGRLEAKSERASKKSLDDDLSESEREEFGEDYKKYSKAADDARLNNRMWGYWREILFSFGTIVLAIGLLATGFTSEGAGRWICLIMLAILMFAYYIGGVASLHTFVPSSLMGR